MKDKRDRRHTIGTLISSFGCGVIPHLDELPLHEGIRCVHASITTFLGSLPEDVREQLEIHFYDDQCHLKAFSEKEQVASKTDITKFFANLHKAVDRFHFKSHKKTDVFCQTKCNPDKVMKEAGISSVTAPTCFYSRIGLQASVAMGDYKAPRDPGEPIVLRFSAYFDAPGRGLNRREQHLAGRREILATSFDTFEEKLRDQLMRSLGSAGFDDERDIVGLTVNRWPHGYSYSYNPLDEPAKWAYSLSLIHI